MSKPPLSRDVSRWTRYRKEVSQGELSAFFFSLVGQKGAECQGWSRKEGRSASRVTPLFFVPALPCCVARCPFCIYSTNRPAAMECHLKTHYKMEYKCRICQTVKANQLELEMHIREHRLGNHYKCDQCGYLSKTANKLIEHVRVHTGERPFHCDQCSYSCKRKDNLNLHKKLKHAPRQTFSCDECLFKTTHPFVFSRHVKKHQNGDCSEEEKKGQYSTSKEASPLLPAISSRNLLSPLSVMSASQALQTVAMSAAHGSGAEPNLAVKALAINGTSLCFDKYWNSEFAHLIPLTMFFPKNHYDLTFHPPRPQTAPGGASSPKHSFLAYLGLTERAETVWGQLHSVPKIPPGTQQVIHCCKGNEHLYYIISKV